MRPSRSPRTARTAPSWARVTASDPDAGDTRTFAITAGNTGDAFAIDPTTGAITVTNAAALDFETTPTFALTVAGPDAGGLTDTATVTVNLTNVERGPDGQRCHLRAAREQRERDGGGYGRGE